MPKAIRDEGVLPLPIGELWKLLHAHLDDDRIREIHPWILNARTIQEGDSMEYRGLTFPRVMIAERVVRLAGRSMESVWTYRIEPPKRYAYDVSFANGSHTRFENSYASTKGGTLVRTMGQVSLVGVPEVVAGWLVKRSLARSDREDLTYVRKTSRS